MLVGHGQGLANPQLQPRQLLLLLLLPRLGLLATCGCSRDLGSGGQGSGGIGSGGLQ
jgi:hypothetical protein